MLSVCTHVPLHVCVHVCTHDCVCAHAYVHVCRLRFCSSVAQKSSPGVILSLSLSPTLIYQQILQPFPFLLYLEPERIPSPPLLPRWLCLCRDKCLLLSGLLIFALADCFQYKTRVVLKTEDRAITPQTHSGTPLLVSCLTR